MIELEIRSPLLHSLVEHSTLPPPNISQQIAQPIVVADLRMLIMRKWVAGLGCQKTSPIGPILARSHQHSAGTSGNDLVAIERETTYVAERPGRSAPVGCP